MLRIAFVSLALLATLAAPATAQEKDAAAQKKAAQKQTKQASEAVTTRHTVNIGGKPLEYTATAGYLTLRHDGGDATAEVFHMAYAKWDGGVDTKRPVTFVFNGGPGSASLWLHLGGVGPRRVAMSDKGEALQPPARLVDNPDSWLAVTDLVFIDPVGTGYSRPAKGHKQSEFSGLEEDTRSVAAFIRAWVTKNRRWASPKFLAGESYGTTRAASVGSALQERYGMRINGIVLVSMVLDFRTIRGGNGNDLPDVLFLPTFAATAWYHKKIEGDRATLLAKAEEFAIERYLVGLAKGSALPIDQHASLAAEYAALTGLDVDYVKRSHIRVGMSRFAKELLRDRGRTVGRLDSRLLGIDRDDAGSRYEYDPSMVAVSGPFSSAFQQYIRDELKFETERPYNTLGGVGRWKYPEGRYPNVTARLRSAMTKNRHLRVLVASGYYDLATPYFAADYTIRHLGLEPELRGNIRMRYYDAGHMMYTHKRSREKLTKDVIEFYRWSLGAAPRSVAPKTDAPTPDVSKTGAAGAATAR